MLRVLVAVLLCTLSIKTRVFKLYSYIQCGRIVVLLAKGDKPVDYNRPTLSMVGQRG